MLSSRQQTCLHPTASKLSGGAANQACKALTSARKCSWWVVRGCARVLAARGGAQAVRR